MKQARVLVDSLRDTQRSAAKAHRHVDVRKMVLFGGGGAALVAVTAGAAAPFIGAALGGSVLGGGLAGNAALLHGLAMIGGGSLAAGGAGMAGGLWVLSGTGALVGTAGGTISAALISLGAEGAQAELIKLQVTFKRVILPGSKRDASAAMADLLIQRDEVHQAQVEGRKRNDDDAPTLVALVNVETALTDSTGWMARELSRS